MSEDIKTMKLYHQVGRVFSELRHLGIADDDPVDVLTLCQFDQYHYQGTDAVHESISELGLQSAMRVLEVGSGIGGPARYLAHACGCSVTAMELQADLNETAEVLTRRTGLSDLVEHECGDILVGVPCGGNYDAVVSWLAFLHIPDRECLYQVCYDSLKPGGGMYLEDYFERGTLTEDERQALSIEVYCDRAPSMSEYHQELSQAGFSRIELLDMSETWTKFVQQRLQGFENAWQRNVDLHGESVTRGLHEFFSTIVQLFTAGNLGGIRAVAFKPE